jgi:hypothetical protein
MSQIKLSPSASGTGIFTIESPSSNTNRTISLPDNTGTILTSATTTGFPAGSVLQVQSAIKTDTFTLTSSTYTDVTGASVSITPSSASSKILVMAYICLGNTTATAGSWFRVVRDSTAIGVGTAAGNRTATAGNMYPPATYSLNAFGWHYLDSPASTSSLTYKIQVASEATYTVTVGRNGSDSDFAYVGRQPTIITVMEIAG